MPEDGILFSSFLFNHLFINNDLIGLYEHCASGDVNKGVNRGVISSKERRKRLLLFLSISGQQGAVLFVGEVKYLIIYNIYI